MSDRIRQMARERAEMKAAAQAHARKVGRTIAAAGYQKASRHKTWGRDVDGYEVFAGSAHDKVHVAMTVSGDDGYQMLRSIQQTLEEAGYIVSREAEPPTNGEVSSLALPVPR